MHECRAMALYHFALALALFITLAFQQAAGGNAGQLQALNAGRHTLLVHEGGALQTSPHLPFARTPLERMKWQLTVQERVSQYTPGALSAAAAASLMPLHDATNGIYDTHDLMVAVGKETRYSLAHGGPRGNPSETGDLQGDPDALALLQPGSGGASLALHNALRQLHRNASVVVHSEDQVSLPASTLARAMEGWMASPVDVNSYITPHQTATSAFGLHHDSMCVAIVQLRGKKTWTLHPPVVRGPVSGMATGNLFHHDGPAALQRSNSQAVDLLRSSATSLASVIHNATAFSLSERSVDAAAAFLGGARPFSEARGLRHPLGGGHLRLPMNVTLGPGDVLYLPHGVPHAAFPVPDSTPTGPSTAGWEQAPSGAAGSTSHHLTVGMLYLDQTLEWVLGTALQKLAQLGSIPPSLLSPLKTLLQVAGTREGAPASFNPGTLDTTNYYGPAHLPLVHVLTNPLYSLHGVALADDARKVAYPATALPTLLRQFAAFNFMAPRSFAPALHPCIPRRKFFFAGPSSTQPTTVRVTMACSVVGLGADAGGEDWRGWGEGEIREQAAQLEDLVAAQRRRFHHRWLHVARAAADSIGTHSTAAVGQLLQTALGASASHMPASVDAASTTVDCSTAAAVTSLDAATTMAVSFLLERTVTRRGALNSMGRMPTPEAVGGAEAAHAGALTPEQLHTALRTQVPGLVTKNSGPPVPSLLAGQFGALLPAQAQNASMASLSQAAVPLPEVWPTLGAAGRTRTLTLRRRSDVPVVWTWEEVGLQEATPTSLDVGANTYYTRFFPPSSPMLAQSGVQWVMRLGGGNGTHAVSTSRSACRQQPTSKLQPFMVASGADPVALRNASLTATARAAASFPPGVPFTMLEACVEGAVQEWKTRGRGRRQGDAGAERLLAHWRDCWGMRQALAEITHLMVQVSALVVDAGSGVQTWAEFPLSASVPHRRLNSTSAGLAEVGVDVQGGAFKGLPIHANFGSPSL